MIIQELRELLEGLPDGWRVILYDENTRSRGPAGFTSSADDTLTIIGVLAGPDQRTEGGVRRDAAGVITHGPSLPCGCPLDADCTGRHT